MKKTELFSGWHQAEYVNSMVWDIWYEWRLEKSGCDSKTADAEWMEFMRTMPKFYKWRPDLRTGMMHFTWEGGEEDVPLSEFYGAFQNQPDLEMLWHCNYWDGPLSGVAKYCGEWVWFDCKEDCDNGDRIYSLYSLSKEMKEELIRRHDLFRECVGHHTDHHPDWHSDFACRDQEKFDEYYNTKWPDIDPKEGSYLADYHWYQFKYYIKPR